MSRSKSVPWPVEDEPLFIEICHVSIVNNCLLGNSFSDKVWEDITKSLTRKSKRDKLYTSTLCTRKWNSLKQSWLSNNQLVLKKTGLGIDYNTRNITGAYTRVSDNKKVSLFSKITITLRFLLYFFFLTLFLNCRKKLLKIMKYLKIQHSSTNAPTCSKEAWQWKASVLQVLHRPENMYRCGRVALVK